VLTYDDVSVIITLIPHLTEMTFEDSVYGESVDRTRVFGVTALYRLKEAERMYMLRAVGL